ncbi:hypothetical protein JR316_0000261 [Psilocybe cubensis]|uniref:Uncharacterized protein n=2 Tax=Psilocybe cubensis TaxID=181762 RepID=A0A8H8CQ60_PSICU|nr:hypothetical protein JR316_0000261 [Psilocybe cubensis]KAH9486197.1 hypothetical protein JR316_0000261 [Psilocybe cubensis]
MSGTRTLVNATVISVSKQGPPQLQTRDVEVDAFTSGGRRILSIDCSAVRIDIAPQPATTIDANTTPLKEEEVDLNLMDVDRKFDVSKVTKKFKQIGEPGGSHGPDDDDGFAYAYPSPNSPDGLLLAYIRQIVHEDLQRPSSDRIDTVHIKSPERHHWLALSGLSPKHLTLSTCDEDKGELASLDRLEQPWTELESLRLEDIHETLWDPEDWATAVSTVSSVTLAHCKSTRLVPTTKFPNLTKLRIIENDALATFVLAAEKVTGFSKRLEVLHLQSTDGRDVKGQSARKRFLERLRKCTRLRELTLVLARADQDIGLVHHIPSSVENFNFHCSCSVTMLEDLDDWLKKARDSKWLPNLKSFTFRADAHSFDTRRTEGSEIGSRILDVPVPPKLEEDEGNLSTDVADTSVDSIDIAEVNARKVLSAEDLEDDDEDDEDYMDNSFDPDELSEEEDDDDDDDPEIKMEDDDDDEDLEFAAADDHNPILLPHISSLIATVLHRLKERNPQLEIVG